MADDLLQGLKDAVGEDLAKGNDDTDPEASIEKIIKSLENMPGMSAESKENLVKSLLEGDLGGANNKLPLGGPIANPWLEFGILMGLVGSVILVLGFIGYKLYNSMTARERRKELKKLQKEQKKKK